MNIETIENGVMITIAKKENYSLEDLKRELVNYLLNKLNKNIVLNETDVDLIKILFD